MDKYYQKDGLIEAIQYTGDNLEEIHVILGEY